MASYSAVEKDVESGSMPNGAELRKSFAAMSSPSSTIGLLALLLQNQSLIVIIAAAALCLLSHLFISSFFGLAVALAGLSYAAREIQLLGSIRAEVDRMSQMNDELQQRNAQLEGSLSSLKQTSDELATEMKGMESLRTSMEEVAKSTGSNFQKVFQDSQEMFGKLEKITLEQEQTLLSQISQDIEFCDREEGISENEFKRFLQRIPRKFQLRFEALQKDYSAYAGIDSVIDFKEMQQLIADLSHPSFTDPG